MKKLKHAEVKVTAFRPVCSRKNLLPESKGVVSVTDWRLANAQPPAAAFTYLERNGANWVSVAEARKLAEGIAPQQRPPRIFLILFRRAGGGAACGDHPEIGQTEKSGLKWHSGASDFEWSTVVLSRLSTQGLAPTSYY